MMTTPSLRPAEGRVSFGRHSRHSDHIHYRVNLMAAKRSYDNSMREKRAHETRERIIRALSKLIAEGSLSDLSVPRVAEMAGVSEPTVYRYFPNREALLDALDEQMNIDFKRPPAPKTLEELPAHVEALFQLFDRDKDLILSFFKSDAGRDARAGLRRRRLLLMRKLLTEMAPHLPKGELDEVFGAVQLLASGDAWRSMGEFAGLSGEQAGRASAWALRTLFEDVRRREECARKAAATKKGSKK